MTLIALSPHLDDAVFSIGQFLAAHTDAKVITVFAGFPDDGLTEYDAKCGFDSSKASMLARHAENRRAMNVLDVDHDEWSFLDGQYGGPDITEVQNRIDEMLASAQPTHLLVPLGLVHPDHVLVATAATAAAANHPHVAVSLYEELPYRIVQPAVAVDTARAKTANRADLTISVGPIETKRAAVECYRSQLTEEWRQCLFVPERIWGLA